MRRVIKSRLILDLCCVQIHFFFISGAFKSKVYGFMYTSLFFRYYLAGKHLSGVPVYFPTERNDSKIRSTLKG